MSKFDPEDQEPIYGPLNAAWLGDSEAQAVAQASFLGEDNEAVRVCFATSNLADLENAQKEIVDAVLANCNTRVVLTAPR